MEYEDGKVGDRVEICGHYGTIISIDRRHCCLPYVIQWDDLPSPMRVLHSQLRKVTDAEESKGSGIQMSILRGGIPRERMEG